jgi:hypothetical protein
MNRTRCKVTTKEGFERKLRKLVVDGLIRDHYQLYKELEAQALHTIHLDNSDSLSRIIDIGLNVVHQQSPTLARLKVLAKKDKRAAVKELLENGTKRKTDATSAI